MWYLSTDTSVVCGTSLLIQVWCVVPLYGYEGGVWCLSTDVGMVNSVSTVICTVHIHKT